MQKHKLLVAVLVGDALGAAALFLHAPLWVTVILAGSAAFITIRVLLHLRRRHDASR
jgi:heme A synthase